MKIEVIRQNRKTISIKLDKDLIICKAPFYLTDREIKGFIDKNIDNLYKKIEKNNKNRQIYDNFIKDGVFLLFGEKSNFFLNEKDNFFLLAKKYLTNRVEELSKMLNFKYNKLSIKDYKSRWGSCDKFKNICLNYKLVMLKKHLIDYVIIHEFCHLIYLNHGKNFHVLLNRLLKDSKLCQKEIKNYSYLTKI